MGKELLRLWGETRATVLFVTHALDDAAVLADCVSVMSACAGRFIEVVATGCPRDRDSNVKSKSRLVEIAARLRTTLRAESLRSMGRNTSDEWTELLERA